MRRKCTILQTLFSVQVALCLYLRAIFKTSIFPKTVNIIHSPFLSKKKLYTSTPAHSGGKGYGVSAFLDPFVIIYPIEMRPSLINKMVFRSKQWGERDVFFCAKFCVGPKSFRCNYYNFELFHFFATTKIDSFSWYKNSMGHFRSRR